MKIFKVEVGFWTWDYIKSVMIIAESKERAIELAIEYDDFFKNNIGEVKEINIKNEGVIHDHIMYG